MKIALLGGNFDPPHIGHYLISLQIKEVLKMDQVWLLPLYQNNSHDRIFHKPISTASHRLAMAGLLKNDFIKASDFEIKHNQTSYTFDTLTGLKKLYPNDKFYWITGSDKLDHFQKYYEWKELITKHNLIIFPREHSLWHLEQKVRKSLELQTIPENVIVLQSRSLILTSISSSVIRDRVRKNLPIRYLVPSEVEEYIREHQLYR